jgi:hypothetical protein
MGPAAFRGALLFCCACLVLAAAMYLLTRETVGRPAAPRPRSALGDDGAAPRP